jgi:hypothetical protein
MNDVEGYFDDPDPMSIGSLLDTLRELPPVAPEKKVQVLRQFMERLEAALVREGEGEQAAALARGGEGEQAAETGSPLAEVVGERRAEVEGRGESVRREEVEGCGEGSRRVADAGITVRSPTLSAPAWPSSFSDCAVFTLPAELRALPLSAEAQEPPPPAEPRGMEAVKTTGPMPNLPAEVWEQRGRLPFRARAPEAEIDRTREVPALNWRKGKTAPVGDDSIEKEVALLPFGEKGTCAGVVPIPRLSLEQYASLRAELAVRPEKWAEIQPQYHVMSVAMRRALDEHWEIELAANPEARAAFEKLLADYTAWVRARGR